MYKAIYFDFDDTLVGTIVAKFAQHKYAYSLLRNGELSDEKIKQHWGEPLDKLISNLYGCETLEEAVEVRKSYGAHSAEFPKIQLEGRADLLKLIKDRKIQSGIVTATIRENLLSDLELLGFDIEMFTHLQCADDTEFHKPDPRVFDGIKNDLQAQGINPDEILFIGDGILDMKAALDAGFGFIGLPNGVTSFKEDFTSNGVVAYEDIYELIEFVRENTETSNELKIK